MSPSSRSNTLLIASVPPFSRITQRNSAHSSVVSRSPASAGRGPTASTKPRAGVVAAGRDPPGPLAGRPLGLEGAHHAVHRVGGAVHEPRADALVAALAQGARRRVEVGG